MLWVARIKLGDELEDIPPFINPFNNDAHNQDHAFLDRLCYELCPRPGSHYSILVESKRIGLLFQYTYEPGMVSTTEDL
jgi:hypothetical protein